VRVTKSFRECTADFTVVVLKRHPALPIIFQGIVSQRLLEEYTGAYFNNTLVRGHDLIRAQGLIDRAIAGTPLPFGRDSRRELYSAAYKAIYDSFPGYDAVYGNCGLYRTSPVNLSVPHELHSFSGTGKQLLQYIDDQGSTK